jgi:hypothetical protein
LVSVEAADADAEADADAWPVSNVEFVRIASSSFSFTIVSAGLSEALGEAAALWLVAALLRVKLMKVSNWFMDPKKSNDSVWSGGKLSTSWSMHCFA